jgi:hypothetical protein
MGTQIQKLKELKYDELITLGVIEKDEDLTSILMDEVKLSFNVLYTLSKEDKLNEKTKTLIKALFDKVILTKTNLINKYLLLAEVDGKDVSEIAEPITPIESIEVKPTKPSKKETLPRRYGKDQILKDVEKQNGVPTNAQLTAIAVNDIRNVYVNLNTRLINDMLTDKPILTDEDYREIRATITILKNRLKPILKKK